jgi:hypothetical protein
MIDRNLKLNPFQKYIKNRKGFVFIVLIVLALGLVGEDDYQQEIVDARHYCEMVGSGVWPHFNTNVNCKE